MTAVLLARVLAVLAVLAGLAAGRLAWHAHEAMVEAVRLPVVLAIGAFVPLLLALAVGLFRRARHAPAAAFGLSLACAGLLVLGLARLGGQPPWQAFLQASCAPGFVVCLPEVAALLRLLALLGLGALPAVPIERAARGRVPR